MQKITNITPNGYLGSLWGSLGVCQRPNPSGSSRITAWYLEAKVLNSFENGKEVILLVAKLWNYKRVILFSLSPAMGGFA